MNGSIPKHEGSQWMIVECSLSSCQNDGRFAPDVFDCCVRGEHVFQFVWSCFIFVIFVKHFWNGNLFYQWVWLQFCINLVAHVTYVLQLGYGTLRSAVHVRGKPRQHTISPIGFAIIVCNFIKFQSAKILWHNTSYTSCFVSHSKKREKPWGCLSLPIEQLDHGPSIGVLMDSICIWSNYTELGRRHPPKLVGGLVWESPLKCQENSGSRFSFIGTTSRLCHGLQRFRKTSCCQPSKTTQWWTTFICCIVQLRWGWETFGAPAAMLRICGASDTDPGLIEG